MCVCVCVCVYVCVCVCVCVQWRSRGFCRPGPNRPIYGRPYWCSRNTFAIRNCPPPPRPSPFAPPLCLCVIIVVVVTNTRKKQQQTNRQTNKQKKRLQNISYSVYIFAKMCIIISDFAAFWCIKTYFAAVLLGAAPGFIIDRARSIYIMYRSKTVNIIYNTKTN